MEKVDKLHLINTTTLSDKFLYSKRNATGFEYRSIRARISYNLSRNIKYILRQKSGRVQFFEMNIRNKSEEKKKGKIKKLTFHWMKMYLS